MIYFYEVSKDESPFCDMRNVRVLPVHFVRELGNDYGEWQKWFNKIEREAEKAVQKFMIGDYSMFKSIKYNRSLYIKKPKQRVILYAVAKKDTKYSNVKYELFYSPYELVFWQIKPVDKNSDFAALYNAVKFNVEVMHSAIPNRCIFDFSPKRGKVNN